LKSKRQEISNRKGIAKREKGDVEKRTFDAHSGKKKIENFQK